MISCLSGWSVAQRWQQGWKKKSGLGSETIGGRARIWSWLWTLKKVFISCKEKLSEQANSWSCVECKLFIVWRPAGCKMCVASFDVKPPRRLYGLMVVLDQLNDHSQILPISHMTVYLIFSDALPWTFRNALKPWKKLLSPSCPWLSENWCQILTLLFRNKGLDNFVV